MASQDFGERLAGFSSNCLTLDPVFREDSLYRRLVEDSETGLLVTDTLSRIVYLNPAGRRLIGLEEAIPEGLRLWDLFDPGESPVVRQIVGEVLERGSLALDYRGRLRSQDGTLYSVLLDLKPLANAEGKTVGVLGSLRDISNLSKANQEMAEQSELKDALLKSIDVGLVLVRNGREVFFQNEVMTERYGVPRDKQCYALYGRTAPCEGCVLEAVLSGQRDRATTLVRGRDKEGKERIVEILSSPVRNDRDEIIAVLEVVVDVTEKSRLAERIKIFAKVVENMQEGVVVSNLEGRILFANDSFTKQTQRSLSELQQLSLSDLFVPREGERLSTEAAAGRLVQGVSGEYECRRMQGGPLPVLLNTFQMGEEHNGPSAVVGVSLDLTERKRLEADLIQSSKLAALGELISGITHELNNPLGAIMGYSQLMLKRIEENNAVQVPEKFVRNLQSVCSEAERASRIIRNLLTFARRHQPDKTPVDLNEVIESTFELRSYDLQINNVRLDLRLGERLPLIMADFNQLQQVFLNLMNNSVQAMLTTGGERVISLQTAQVGDHLQVRFSDRGPGIPAEVVPKIFDPFFTTKEVGKGTGLGLSICLGIIKEHGGTIEVDSAPGQGTTFVVTLPLGAIRDAVRSAQEEPLGAIEAQSKTILVVDDEMHMRRILEEYLEGQGFRVISVGDGFSALKYLGQEAIDLIITDVRMPRMDGKEFYRELNKRYPRLTDRIIFLTGDFLNEETMAFIESTGNRKLRKPVSLGRLLRLVTGMLQGEE